MNSDKRLFWFRYLPVLAAAFMCLVLVAGGMIGCQSGPPEGYIQGKVAQKLSAAATAAIGDWDREIARINGELFAAETKLGKLGQVVDPALKWIDLMKATAQKEQWNGRVLEVSSDLNKLKNDQYKVAKLQFMADMLTAGMKYSSVIMIDDQVNAQVTAYEELRDTLKAQVSSLSQQREARIKMRTNSRSLVLGMFDQYKTWKLQKVNSVTYTVTGQGLGMETAPTVGVWTYYTDSEVLNPEDKAAVGLQKALTGK